jgi:hypothetical protein
VDDQPANDHRLHRPVGDADCSMVHPDGHAGEDNALCVGEIGFYRQPVNRWAAAGVTIMSAGQRRST